MIDTITSIALMAVPLKDKVEAEEPLSIDEQIERLDRYFKSYLCVEAKSDISMRRINELTLL